MLRDLRHAFLALGKAPGFTAMVVLTLALGIAATTAIFSVVYGVVLRPLPFPDSERLVRLCEVNEAVAGFCVASPPDVADWSRQSRSFDGFGVARDWSFVIQGQDGQPEEVTGAYATPGFLPTFGVAPLLGRGLEAADTQPGQARVVVLSHGFWQSRLGGDPAALERTLTLNGESHTIVGVLPAGTKVPELEEARFWVPLPFQDEQYRRWRGFQAIGRLAAGVSRDEALAELTTIAARLSRQYPETNDGWEVALVPLRERVVGSIRSSLLAFLGAGAFVLLIGCTNVASMLLSRALARQGEMAMRAALGARRGRLIRLLLTECLAYAGLGGALGLFFAHGLVKAFVTFAPGELPRIDEIAVDATAYAFALGISLVTSLLFGLAPALRATRPDLGQALKSARQEPSGSAFGPRNALVVSEVALALVLLIGAGLLIRSFTAAARWQTGLDRDHLLIFSVLVSDKKYPHRDQLANVYQQAIKEIQAVPGVISAGATSAGPLFGGRETGEFVAAEEPRSARWFDVDPHYFRTLGIALVKGREFTEQDQAAAPAVAIVNETMAHQLWPDEDAIGKRVRGPGDSTREVVGVVADVVPFWPATETEPEIYWPTSQQPRWGSFLVVRALADISVQSLSEVIRGRLHEVDPDMSVGTVFTLGQVLQARLRPLRFNMLLLGSFAVVALVLAVGGIYGVLAYSISRRRREIGLRMALGAGRREILRWVIGRGLKLTTIGLGFGLVGAFALTKVLLSMLYETRPTDAATYIGVIGLLALAALLACYVPARRAAQVEPMSALRSE